MAEMYARLSHAKQAGAAARTSGDDPVWVRSLAAATAEIDSMTGRSFSARVGTWYLDVRGPSASNNWGTRLWMPFDVAEITSLKPLQSSPLTYGTALVENTDYLVQREAGEDNAPISYLERLSDAWTPGARSLQLVGVRGYSYEVEDTWQTVQDDPLSSSSTTLTLLSTSDISEGETLRLGDEQVSVRAVVDATTLTIVRAVNGTTAAEHAQGVTVYRRRYPRDIEQAAIVRAIDFKRGAPGAFGGQAGGEEAGFSNPTSFAQFAGLVRRYKRWSF